MSASRWPVVLFDLDGTLADTIPLIIASYNHAFRTVLGRERDEREIRSWIGRPLLESFAAAAPHHAAELDRVYREWNLAHTDDMLREYPGVQGLVRDLTAEGLRLGVVTSKRRQGALLALRGVGLGEHVQVLSALEDTSRHKPHPDPLLHAAARLEVAPASCVYVGDAVVDVTAARAAGMGAVAVTWGAGERSALEAAGPDLVADGAEELLQGLLDGSVQGPGEGSLEGSGT